MKKLFALLGVAILVATTPVCTTTAMAFDEVVTETTTDDAALVEDGTFEFVSSKSRMDSDGTFTYRFNYRLTSDSFVANSSSFTIDLGAYLFYGNTSTDIITDSSKIDSYGQYKLILYKGSTLVNTYTLSTSSNDTITVSATKGSTYYFVLEKKTENLQYYIKGSGTVTGVTVK